MNELSLVIPTIILLVAAYTDVRTRKVYNKWVIVSIFLALISSYYFYGLEGLKQGAAASGLSLLLTLPLVLIGILGAGDMKILFAFALSTTYQTVFAVAVFSLIWGAVLGIVSALREGRGKQLIHNTVGILTANPPETNDLHRIPFAAAIFSGWITYVVIGYSQGSL